MSCLPDTNWFFVQNGKAFNCFDRIDAFLDQPMNFAVTTHTKLTKVFQRAVRFISVDVMNIQPFFGFRTNFAFINKVSVPNEYITPRFISFPVSEMFRSLQGFLTFFGTKTARLFSIWEWFIDVFAHHTSQFNSWFSSANHRAKSSCFNAIGSRVKFLRTSFADFNGFRSQSHLEQVYVN